MAVDNKVFRQFVASCEEFRQRKMSLSEIFERMDLLKEDVEIYLQQLVWHRLDKVAPLMEKTLGIKMPVIGELMRHIIVRHDIVHRGGKTKEGNPVIVSGHELGKLRGDVVGFVNDLEAQLSVRFPETSDGLLDDNEF